MKPYTTRILGCDALGATTMALLAATWAPSTAATYGSTIRRCFDFCAEQQHAPLAATPAHVARYVAWLGQLGTIKASSLKPYLSAVNGFFKDHGLEAIALGDPVAKVRKGEAASQVASDDTPVRVHLPAAIIVKALRMARKGQREVSAERKLLCHMPPTVHTEVIHILLFFDTIRHTLSGGKYPTARWAISTSERHERWAANTLIRWLTEVTSALQE
jgi:hypothetical protein